LTRWNQPSAPPSPDGEATGLEEFLEELLALEGVLMAVLLDRSGRVMAARGCSPDVAEDAAALAAAIHASGARLGEAAGDSGFPRMLIQAKERSVLITSLPVRAGIPLVLLVATEPLAMEDLGPRLEQISGVTLDSVVGLGSVDDPEAFEASLLESLDGLFPRGATS
jgi:predicted regulator of Ras-like GTPase activity (Roadblock/LC7/MglB family)